MSTSTKPRFLKPDDIELTLSEEIPELNPDGCNDSTLVTYNSDDCINSIEQQRQQLPVFKWRTHFIHLVESNNSSESLDGHQTTTHEERLIPKICSVVLSRVVVVTGETGSGKSTQLGQYLYEAGWLAAKPTRGAPHGAGMIITQPRRVAALTLATRVAEEKNWRLGAQVGYAIRFEECCNPEMTVISYMTEGMLIQELLRDPLLKRFRVVMLDEVHERSLQTDVLLGLMKKVLRKRPFDLRLVISSATLQVEKYLAYFSDIDIASKTAAGLKPAVQLSVEGRQFPVQVFYSSDPVPCYLRAAKDTVFQIHENRPLGGDILVFVTSQQEVMQLVGDLVHEYRDRKDRLQPKKPPGSNAERKSSTSSGYQPLRCLPMHGSLPQSDQLRVFERPSRACRRVVVATNIAEASVTISGITYVVDCGYCRLKAYNPATGLEALVTAPISQASARQRAGRAGRTRPGEVYRLYPQSAFDRLLPQYTPPEAIRSDLSGCLLCLKTLGVDQLARFPWLDPPAASHVGQAAERLVALAALDPLTGRLALPRGPQLAELATACGLNQPSAAAALLGACEEGCSQEVAAIVALMQIQHVFVSTPGQKRTGDRLRRRLFGCHQGDHLTELNAFTAYQRRASGGCSPSELRAWCRDVGLNARGLAHAASLRDRISGIFRRLKLPWVVAEPPGNPEPILRALVRGYFHQVARKAASGGHYLTVRGDHRLRLHPNCILYSSTSQWPAWILFTNVFLATSSEGETGPPDSKAPTSAPTCVSGVSVVQPDWLLELAPHYFRFGTDREHVEQAFRRGAAGGATG